MKKEQAFWVVVPAAGAGRRMGGDIPKQYLMLCGKSVLDHSLEHFVSNPRIRGVYVPLSPHDAWWSKSRYSDHPGVVRVDGGDERAQSVLNALRALDKVANPDDWVLVHDAARPCLRQGDLNRLMERLSEHPVGGILGTPLHDTVKRADRSGGVIETLPREEIWRAFTPQMFHLGALRLALESAFEAGVPVTDEAAAMERIGEAPELIEGHADNIKITHPQDLELAAFYLDRQQRPDLPPTQGPT